VKVLIADDDPISLKLLQGVLTDWGYQVITATDGTEAWRVLQENEAPKLAILDWTMPGLEGIEICRRLRQQQTLTPTYAILLTVRTTKGDLVAGLEAGANDFLTKPFDWDELRARVQVGQKVVELQANVANRMREFEEYVDASPLAILFVEPNGEIAFANSSASSYFGYQPGELIGQPIEILVPFSLQERHVRLCDDYLKKPERRLMAGRGLRGQRKNGSTLPVAIGLNPLTSTGTVRVACSIMDMTEIYKLEQDFVRFFDLSLDLFCIASVKGFFLRVNPKIEQLLGYSAAELLSRPFFEYVTPEDVPAVRAQVERLALGESVVDFRCRIRDRPGKDHWVELNAMSIPAEGLIYAVGRDLSERLRMEEELLVQQRREHAILTNTPAVVYIKGTDGRYQFVNKSYAELFSLDQDAVLGKCVDEFFPAEVTEAFAQHDRKVIETGETITIDEIVPHEEGNRTYVSVKFPLFDTRGQVSAVASISTDITEQLRARQTAAELTLAQSFQRKLYPAKTPLVIGLDVAGSAIPVTHLCGDYFDFVQLAPNRLVIAIGDVSGHGVGPALEMVVVRTTLRLLLHQGRDVTEVIGVLNQMLCADLPESSFVSLFVADIDVATGQIRYLGAGHDGFLIRADGAVTRLESTHGFLGIEPSVSFLDMASFSITQGDTLFLFTDGLTEANNVEGDQYGRQRAVETVSRDRREPADGIVRNLFVSVYEFTSGCNSKDDISAIVLKLPAGS